MADPGRGKLINGVPAWQLLATRFVVRVVFIIPLLVACALTHSGWPLLAYLAGFLGVLWEKVCDRRGWPDTR